MRNSFSGGSVSEIVVRGRASSGLYVAGTAPLWTPDQGSSGLVAVAPRNPLLAVIGSRILVTEFGDSNSRHEIAPPDGNPGLGGEVRPTVTLGGLVIMSGARQKEPTRVIGHPDLASGASVQRGETLYVSVAEAIYRESRGEYVEIHLTPTEEDNSALSDLRTRARHRWENDRLPDGWTRPLPPSPQQQVVATPTPKEVTAETPTKGLSDDLRRLAEEIKGREKDHR